MSNALYYNLCLLASGNRAGDASAATKFSPRAEHLLYSLLGVGMVVLGIWVVRRTFLWIAHRQGNGNKLTLANTPGRPNSVNPLHVLLVFILLQSVPLRLVYVVRDAMKLPDMSKIQILQLIILGQLLALIAAVIIGKFCFRFALRRGMGLSGRHWMFDTGRSVLGFLAVLPVCYGLVMLCTYLMREFRLGEIHPHSMLTALHEMGVGGKTLIAVSAIILAPLLEEFFFRGLLQSMLRRYVKPWPAILITSVLFAAVHHEPQNMPALFVLSVVLGYNYERTGRLFSPILIHVLFNGTMIVLHLV
ncbi:MAG: CPBP family intramembrane metalloprotease [Phycisphaerae bacterium]|nr:CPBP family intramembrane metalloprotease [Phycisphaerae bacterium]